MICGWWMLDNPSANVLAQEPTPTVSLAQPTNQGMFITVSHPTENHVNVRSGPSSDIYPMIGVLPIGATAPALGRSSGGDWIQIELLHENGTKGWVYIGYVTVSPGILPVIEPPPTPVPPPTATIDPTLVAQFNSVPTSTRLPTFTPAPALVSPVYEPDQSSPLTLPFPTGIAILFLGSVGILGLLYSFLERN